MCGLFACFSTADKIRNLSFDVVNSCLESLEHRGPDNKGVAFITKSDVINFPFLSDQKNFEYKIPTGTHAILGHRRLSIIDLNPSSSQPMMSECGRYMIVYNGEIYNYEELREELILKGISFRSKGDTEVFLHSYAQWGVKCFNKFNGEWAALIFDQKLNKLIVSRDRFGIKPLFYYKGKNTLIFGSEIKVLLKTGLVPKTINNEYLNNYLEHGDMSFSDKTAFENIYKFPKAHFSQIELGNVVKKLNCVKYWELKPNLSNEKFCPKKAEVYALDYRNLLNDAVRIRMRSDVPIGVSLSGGLDSSSIAFLCKCYHDPSGENKLMSYSLIHPDLGKEHCDESEFIDIVSKSLNLKTFYKTPDVTSIPSTLEKISHFYEAPPNGLAVAGTFTISAAKEAGIAVTLDGQGADEQLAGYEKYIPSFLANLKISTMLREAFWLLYNSTEKMPTLKLIVKSISKWFKRFFGFPIKTLNEELADSFDKGLMNLIHYSDRRSMMNSIESRMPFLDHRLVEFNASVPSAFKIHKGYTKFYARLAFQNHLPDSIIWRKDKNGWNTPEAIWLNGYLKKWSENLIDSFEHENFKIAQLKRHSKKKTEYKVRVLNLITFLNYYRK